MDGDVCYYHHDRAAIMWRDVMTITEQDFRIKLCSECCDSAIDLQIPVYPLNEIHIDREEMK